MRTFRTPLIIPTPTKALRDADNTAASSRPGATWLFFALTRGYPSHIAETGLPISRPTSCGPAAIIGALASDCNNPMTNSRLDCRIRA